MKRILLIAAALVLLFSPGGCGETRKTEQSPKPVQAVDRTKEEPPMKIKVSDGKNTVVFALNQSQAARGLWNQLPLTIDVENYGSNEKSSTRRNWKPAIRRQQMPGRVHSPIMLPGVM